LDRLAIPDEIRIRTSVSCFGSVDVTDEFHAAPRTDAAGKGC